MYAKIRSNSSGFISNSAPHDIVCALFESQATTLPQLLAACASASANAIDVSNSFITTAKTGHGWTVDYVNGATVTRPVILKALCKDSTKNKFVSLTSVTSNSFLSVGTGRNAGNLIDPIAQQNWYSSSTLSSNTVVELHISASPRHLFLMAVRLDTGVSIGSAVFEFVTNDGYFSATSPYIPVCQASRLDANTNFTTSSRALYVPRYKNMRAANYPDVTTQMCYWYTPYSEDSFSPIDNNGYDYLGTNSDRTPLLVPFGVCNKSTHGFIGGAISDLCDVYLGPNNVGGNFEETLIGTDTYIAVPINSGTKRMFLPKG